MKTYTRPFTTAALALALALPTFGAPKAAKPSLSAELGNTLQAAAKTANTPSKRLAQEYGALALLPAEASEYICLSDISGLLQQMGADKTPGFPMELTAIDSLAIGSSAANAKLYPALLAFAQKAGTRRYTVDEQGEVTASTDLESAFAELAKAPALAPVYIALTCKDGQEELINSLGSLIGENQFLSPVSNAPAGFKGGKVNWDRVLAESDLPAAAQATLRKRPLHLFAKTDGQKLILIACENPAKIAALPGSPLDSALAKTAGDLRPGAAGQSPVFTLHLSAKAAKAITQTSKDGELDALVAQAQGTPAEACINALAELGKTYRALPITKPGVLQVWRDSKGISISGSLDAQKAGFQPGLLRLGKLGDSPSTILYAASTPFSNGDSLPSVSRCLKIVADAFAGLMFVNSDPSMAMLPTVQAVTTSLETMLSSLTGNTAIIVDAKGKAPASLGIGDNAPLPRIGVYAAIDDRAQLAQGWEQFTKAMEDAGLPPEQMLPIESKASGKVMSYSIADPLFTKEFTPNAILTDKHMAFGTCPALNIQMLKAVGKDKNTAKHQGAVFVLRFKPIAKAWKQMEDAQNGGDSEGMTPSTATMTIRGIAETIDNVHGGITIANGTYIFIVRIDFTVKASK